MVFSVDINPQNPQSMWNKWQHSEQVSGSFKYGKYCCACSVYLPSDFFLWFQGRKAYRSQGGIWCVTYLKPSSHSSDLFCSNNLFFFFSCYPSINCWIKLRQKQERGISFVGSVFKSFSKTTWRSIYISTQWSALEKTFFNFLWFLAVSRQMKC